MHMGSHYDIFSTPLCGVIEFGYICVQAVILGGEGGYIFA